MTNQNQHTTASDVAPHADQWRDELAAFARWLGERAGRIDPASQTAHGEIIGTFLSARRRLDGLCEQYLDGRMRNAPPRHEMQEGAPQP